MSLSVLIVVSHFNDLFATLITIRDKLQLSYGVSIILRPPASEKFFTSTLPFLLGSMGTLVFDAVILLQTAYYRRPNRIHLQ